MSYLESLYDILEFQAGVRELADDKVWVRLVEKTAAVIGAEAATLFLAAPKGRQLFAHYTIGVPVDLLNKVPVEVGQGLCGWVAAHREPLLVEDAYKDPRFLQDIDAASGFKTRSVLCVPLLDRLELIGVAEFLNRRAGPFGKEELEFVGAVCRNASLLLRIPRLEAMLDKVTSHNQNILENLTGGFLAVDVRGRVIICNPAAKRILSIEDEVLDRPVKDALRSVPVLADVLSRTIASRQAVKRQEFTWSPAGKPRRVGYSTLLIQDPRGNFTGAGVTFQDLTAVKG